jgi:hypothetical protein
LQAGRARGTSGIGRARKSYKLELELVEEGYPKCNGTTAIIG